MKEKTITLVEENYWIENKYALMCGVTEEHINSSGGINMGKFFSAKALNISNSIQYDSGVNIDEVIIVPDFSIKRKSILSRKMLILLKLRYRLWRTAQMQLHWLV